MRETPIDKYTASTRATQPRVLRLVSRSPSVAAESLSKEEQALLKYELESRAKEHQRMCMIDHTQPPFRKDVETQEIIAMIRYGILKAQPVSSKRMDGISAKAAKKVRVRRSKTSLIETHFR